MKLHEIVDTEFRDTASPDTRNTPSKFKDTKLVGAGYYSTAHQPRNNPYEIHKASRRSFKYDANSLTPTDDDVDPYYDWVKAIAPYAKSNPYLPRVYVANNNKDKTGALKPEYEMEKLFDYKTVPINVLYNLLYNESLDYDAEELYVNDLKRLIKSGNYSAEEIHELGARKIWFRTLRYMIANVRKDPQIQEALDIIDKLVAERGYRKDLHSGNFMIRSTSIGPQIVITDPIAHKVMRVNHFI